MNLPIKVGVVHHETIDRAVRLNAQGQAVVRDHVLATAIRDLNAGVAA